MGEKMRTIARLLGDLLIGAIAIFVFINVTAFVFHKYNTDLFIGLNIVQHTPVTTEPSE
jgi:hypothetical protein